VYMLPPIFQRTANIVLDNGARLIVPR